VSGAQFITGLVVLLVLEVILISLVRSLRRNYQWLITEQDELPEFNSAALKKYLASSFDPELGWVRKPNTEGTEKGRQGSVKFHIDASGSRHNPFSSKKAQIATFGDSYTFCRQVNDPETWPAQMSRLLDGVGVLNFGVGNYGVDQALLRYERADLEASVKVVILGFVPETICRIQSAWKHYLEFGNTFAFKPRFMLRNNELSLIPSIVRSEEGFVRLAEKLPSLQEIDFFYQKKFRLLQFRIPYVFSFFRNPIRNIELIAVISFVRMAKFIGLGSARLSNLPFLLVMKRNIREAHALYGDHDSKALLRSILLRFRDVAHSRGHHPVLAVMPQFLDFLVADKNNNSYQDFYERLASDIDVIDFTQTLQEKDLPALYVEDQYGGHFSALGNSIVAEKLVERCSGYL
jgi:hypothetical protein